jgi:DNA invertase Pin-like site-specific DNA recombinase
MTALIYIRVSTKQQTISPEAQKNELTAYCEQQGWEVADVVQETASGKDDDRQGLADAVARCAREGHKLVIKRIDRLSRKLSKTAELIENPNVEIVCSETGPVHPMVLAMLAVMASEEARLISVRTKSALAQRKADGQLLGFALHGTQVAKKAGKKSGLTRKEKADKHALRVGAVIDAVKNANGWSYEAIAADFNECQYYPTSYRASSAKDRWVTSRVHSIHRKYIALMSSST